MRFQRELAGRRVWVKCSRMIMTTPANVMGGGTTFDNGALELRTALTPSAPMSIGARSFADVVDESLRYFTMRIRVKVN